MTYRILTVCTGNICRSPMAEVVLADVLAKAGVDAEVDSAAVTSGEVGNPIDYRAQEILRSAGYAVPHRAARKMDVDDLEEFDLILPMTAQHESAINRIARNGGLDPNDPALAEIRLFRTFATDADERGPYEMDVPDPWYGGRQDFIETLETIEDALENIVEYVREQTQN